MTNYPANIAQSGLTIYDVINPINQELYIPTNVLEYILNQSLIGLSLQGYRLRTRSKKVKSEICKALGYPIPLSFKRTKPQFPGQNFDVYIQKRHNVQIWNESIDYTRRYVFLKTSPDDFIVSVKVITGIQLASYSHTGTLSTKYQARMKSYGQNICSPNDSIRVQNWMSNIQAPLNEVNPNHSPQKDQLLSIQEIYYRLSPLVGQYIDYLDPLQERNRGAKLHAMICKCLGYSIYEDDGNYPDIVNQLLEIKLQTSPTIDLGLHSPTDGKPIITLPDITFYSEDIRYVIFDGVVYNNLVHLRNLYLVTGQDFPKYFPLFGGKTINTKLQIPLPHDFFIN